MQVFAKRLAMIAVAGMAGTVSRYLLTVFVQDRFGRNFPWGTMSVNIIGCLVFGAFIALVEKRQIINEEISLCFAIGFLGAFTTFSSLVYESVELARNGQMAGAMLNYALQTVLGFAAFIAGFQAGRFWE